MKEFVAACLGLICMVGCGGGGPAGSCRIPASGSAGQTCIDFTKGYATSDAMQTCSVASGATYSSDSCPTANRVGRCTASSPDGAFTQVNNYYAPTTASDAMTACAGQRGTFEAN